MMSTVLHSDSLLTPAATTNPFISFNGGFTPWEKLESFFTSSDKISKSTLPVCDESKPNLSCYHADLVLDSESTNQTLPSCVEPNLDSYHVGLDLDLESPNQTPPSFHKPDISRYHAESNIGSNVPNQHSPSFEKPSPDNGQPNQNSPISSDISRYYAESNMGSDVPNQHSPPFEKPSPPDNGQPDQNSPISSSSSGGGSDDPIQNQPDSTLNSSFQDPPAQVASTMDERKRKRMISNRESARRSRVRKQRHVENLRNSMNELKIQTRERSNQLRLMTHQINLVKRENDRLKAESIILQRNLMQFNQIWQLQQLLQQQQQQQQRSYHHYHHPPPPSATSCTPMQLIL